MSTPHAISLIDNAQIVQLILNDDPLGGDLLYAGMLGDFPFSPSAIALSTLKIAFKIR